MKIDERGSIEQKKNCLARVLTHPQHGILPKFYSLRLKSGMRHPGDGGPDPQAETDYESTEDNLGELPKKAQEPRRYKQGCHKELFDSAGCEDITPPVLAGLVPRDQTGKTFTCRLDQLFPVPFAGHKLIGLGHNAAPDILMLRLMVLL